MTKRKAEAQEPAPAAAACAGRDNSLTEPPLGSGLACGLKLAGALLAGVAAVAAVATTSFPGGVNKVPPSSGTPLQHPQAHASSPQFARLLPGSLTELQRKANTYMDKSASQILQEVMEAAASAGSQECGGAAKAEETLEAATEPELATPVKKEQPAPAEEKAIETAEVEAEVEAEETPEQAVKSESISKIPPTEQNDGERMIGRKVRKEGREFVEYHIDDADLIWEGVVVEYDPHNQFPWKITYFPQHGCKDDYPERMTRAELTRFLVEEEGAVAARQREATPVPEEPTAKEEAA